MIDMSGAILIQQRKQELLAESKRQERIEKAKEIITYLLSLFFITGFLTILSALDSIIDILMEVM